MHLEIQNKQLLYFFESEPKCRAGYLTQRKPLRKTFQRVASVLEKRMISMLMKDSRFFFLPNIVNFLHNMGHAHFNDISGFGILPKI